MTGRTPVIQVRDRPDGDRRRPTETGRNRLLVAAAVFGVAFLVIAIRLVDVTLLQDGYEPRLARSPVSERLTTGRADIVDRNGVLIATSLPTASLFANPRIVLDADRAAARLVRVLPDLDETDVRAKLKSGRSFVWLRRHLTPEQQYRINKLGIPGLDFQREERRLYPTGNLASHVIGFTDVDGHGLAGIERKFDESLRARRRPLALSLDIRAQHILRTELLRAMKKFRALGAAGIVSDTRTGEVIAMVSLPDFDPNKPSRVTTKALFNRNTMGVYEMGSTFKIFTTAMALDAGTVNLKSGFDASRPIRIARFTIRDFHGKKRWLSVPEIFMYSSNIGAAKMAVAVGGDRQRAFLSRLGLLSRSPIELAEIGEPLTPRRWSAINTMTIAFGHGLAVSPIHVIGGVTAVVNGGILYPPTILRREAGAPSRGERVMSAHTSDRMRRLMRLVVDRGTGKKARAVGYLVGGKTGTAEKAGRRRYRSKALISSFVGAFPMHAPRFVVLALLDEAHGTRDTLGYATGGWVAAPAVGRVIKRLASIYGISPVDEKSPELQRRMNVTLPSSKSGARRLASY